MYPLPPSFQILTQTLSAMRNWMNSLGVDPFVHSFYDDLRDGLVLIQASMGRGTQTSRVLTIPLAI
jgi:hypothetical protein